jgi:hypothetical protein
MFEYRGKTIRENDAIRSVAKKSQEAEDLDDLHFKVLISRQRRVVESLAAL